MAGGACAQRENSDIFLCFTDEGDLTTAKVCYQALDPLGKFSKMQESNFGHLTTRIAATSGKSK